MTPHLLPCLELGEVLSRGEAALDLPAAADRLALAFAGQVRERALDEQDVEPAPLGREELSPT